MLDLKGKKETRELLKQQKGIVNTEKGNKSCKNCYLFNAKRFCGKHSLITLINDTCGDFLTRQIKIYRGGSASSK
jgi:hypothetical protein